MRKALIVAAMAYFGRLAQTGRTPTNDARALLLAMMAARTMDDLHARGLLQSDGICAMRSFAEDMAGMSCLVDLPAERDAAATASQLKPMEYNILDGMELFGDGPFWE